MLQSQNNSPITRKNPYPEMTYIKGGKANFGNEKGEENEKPAFASQMRSFYVDNQPISVAQFRLFARVNRYITTAEIQGFSEKLVNKTDLKNLQTEKIAGAYWEYPLGKSAPKAQDDEPVRHLSWQDARAYSSWIQKRLPTEFELEYALQKEEKNQEQNLKFFNGESWHWSESAFTKYDAQNYYAESNKNPLRTIKGGAGNNRPSARVAVKHYQTFYEVIFRCVKDEERGR